MENNAAAGAGFAERILPPASWWVITEVIGLSVALALAVYLPPVWAVALLVATAVALGLALVAVGHTVRVTEDALWVDRNHVEWEYVGKATAMDEAATRRRLGPDADASNALMTRPYLHKAVDVTIQDVEDPHPAWIVGTRRPVALAAAIDRAREASRG